MQEKDYKVHPNYVNVKIANDEQWKDIPGYEGFYQVSTQGRVRSLDRVVPRPSRWGGISQARIPGGVMNPGKDSRGYLLVFLYKNNMGDKRSVHRLVLSTFIPSAGWERLECCHNDGNPCNNHLENLRWGTHKENHQDRKTHGTDNQGTKNGSAKLTEKKVVRIRKLYATGKVLVREIANKFGMTEGGVDSVLRGTTWGHVKKGLPKPYFGRGKSRLKSMGRL